MKKIFDGIKFGIGIIFSLIIFFIIGYFVVKARNGTTADVGDKLTASKWNELTNNVNILSGKVNGSLGSYEAITTTCNSTQNCIAYCSSGKIILGGSCRRVVNGLYINEAGQYSNGRLCSWDTAPTTSQATVYCAKIN